MKKVLIVVLALLLVVTGCASKPAAEQPPKQTLISIGAGPTGGAYYPIAGGVADLINKNLPQYMAKVEITGGAQENCSLVADGKTEIAITNANLAYFATQGTAPYTKKHTLSTLGNLHASIAHIVVRADSNIRTIADFKGKSVGVGTAGAGANQMFKDLLTVYGLSIDDIKPSYLPYDQSHELLKDGRLDGSIVLSGFPAASINELAITKDIRFIGVEPNKIAEFEKMFPYYKVIALPEGIKNKNTEQVMAPSVFNILVVNSAISEAEAYNFTKSVFDNLDSLSTYHAAAKGIDLKNGTKVPIDMHPGALKYFKEKGIN